MKTRKNHADKLAALTLVSSELNKLLSDGSFYRLFVRQPLRLDQAG